MEDAHKAQIARALFELSQGDTYTRSKLFPGIAKKEFPGTLANIVMTALENRGLVRRAESPTGSKFTAAPLAGEELAEMAEDEDEILALSRGSSHALPAPPPPPPPVSEPVQEEPPVEEEPEEESSEEDEPEEESDERYQLILETCSENFRITMAAMKNIIYLRDEYFPKQFEALQADIKDIKAMLELLTEEARQRKSGTR